MKKMYVVICSLLTTCLLGVSAQAFTPVPDGPTAEKMMPFQKLMPALTPQLAFVSSTLSKPITSIEPVQAPKIMLPLISQTASTSSVPASTILPLPPNWPPFAIIPMTVTGTIISMGPDRSAHSSSTAAGEIGTMQFPMKQSSSSLVGNDLSGTTGNGEAIAVSAWVPNELLVFVPSLATTTRVGIASSTKIMFGDDRPIDASSLRLGDSVEIIGTRFKGSTKLIFADIIKLRDMFKPTLAE